MNSLYERIVNCGEDESLRDIFSSLNLADGYGIMDKIDAKDHVKDRLIKYVAYVYSYQSPMLKSKDVTENKKKVLQKVGLDSTGDFAVAVIKNQDENLNLYIRWWLDVNEDADWALYTSGQDFVADQLLFVREGLDIKWTGDDPKKAQWFIKNVKKDSDLKAKAWFNADKAIERLKEIRKSLDVKYEFLEGVVKKDVPEYFEGTMNWAERRAKKNREKHNHESSRKERNLALPQS